jgi:hypothetical protein
MSKFVVREGVLSLDKDQVAQLEAAGQEHALSGTVVHTLHELARHLSRGEAVYVYPDEAALTVAQAASMFHLLRPNLEKRLNDGEIPSFQRGSERYVYVRDMIAYDQAQRSERRRLIDVIQQTSEEMGAYK